MKSDFSVRNHILRWWLTLQIPASELFPSGEHVWHQICGFPPHRPSRQLSGHTGCPTIPFSSDTNPLEWARTQQFKGSIPQDYLPTADTNSKSWTNWLLTNQESNSLKFSLNSGKQLTCNCRFIMKPTTEEEPTEEMHRATYGGGVQGFLALFGPPSQHLSVFINL